jgi:hypothetical protein
MPRSEQTRKVLAEREGFEPTEKVREIIKSLK